jgi:5'-3' exonuclease
MGVPRLYPWIQKKFDYAIKRFQQGEHIQTVDYFYLDANSFLHGVAQHVFNYGSSNRKMDIYKNLSSEAKNKKVYSMFFEFIVQLTQMIIPRKALYIAIDGPAPLAKQNQQRERRFQKTKERLESDTTSGEPSFDSSSMTPGTMFMAGLTRYINYAIRKEMNSYGQWKKIDVYFSPPNEAGEGEHKFVNFIRDLPHTEKINSSHCMYGNDGDLVMLALAAHVPNIFIFRGADFVDKKTGKGGPGYFDLVDMGMIKTNLNKFLPVPLKNGGNSSSSRSKNDIIDDFILEGFFLGNDFLPKIQMFHVGNLLFEGLELMIDTYLRTSRGISNFLVVGGKIDLQGFKNFVNEVSKHEEKLLKLQVTGSKKQRHGELPLGPEFENKTLLSCIIKTLPPGSKEVIYKLDMKNYRIKYYQKCGILNLKESDCNPTGFETPTQDENNKFNKDLKKMCYDYLRSFIWVFKYYIDGLPSWRWAYEYHYAPLMIDFNHYLQSLDPKDFHDMSKFDLESPSLPFEQLLSVIHPSSSNLLPKSYQRLMIDPKSPLVKLGYYPTDFKIDYEGKLKSHEGLILLPFVNYDNVHKYYKKTTELYIKDPNIFIRNTPGRTSLFRYDETYNSKFTSDMGNINNLHVKRILL